jgi:hypothetical protein
MVMFVLLAMGAVVFDAEGVGRVGASRGVMVIGTGAIDRSAITFGAIVCDGREGTAAIGADFFGPTTGFAVVGIEIEARGEREGAELTAGGGG